MRQPLVAPTLYSIGNPTDEEQLYLELINRARAAPQAESLILKNTTDPLVLSAYTAFSVDLSIMVTQFSTISSNAPLSMNAKLLAAARLHSQDMFDHQFQDHAGSSGGSPASRIADQLYSAVWSGENVYAYAQSVLHGHAGFEVDWGDGPGGMQSPPGHRINIHTNLFLEVGIGVVNGINGSVGPQIVTQDFGTRVGTGSDPNAVFITGVAYYDFNNNGFYDVGEGIAGVTVTVAGQNYYAVTSESGGYSVPIYSDGNYTVTFTASGFSNQVAAVVSGANSVKKDFRPAYTPPVISGPSLVGVGQAGAFLFSPVGAATSYQWKQNRLVAFTSVEGAESGLTTNVTVTASPGYQVVTNDVKKSGNSSFHLVHSQPIAQVLSLNRLLRPTAASQLIFASRLGYATSDQVARAQISTNSGVSWQDVWSQAGNGSSGQILFATQAVSLSAFADQEVLVRFVYDHLGGGYFNQTSTGFGLYLDDIAVSNADEILDPVVTDIPTGTAFNFTPSSTGGYSLRVRAKVSNRILPYGPAKFITVSLVQITKVQTISDGSQAQIDFTLTNSTAGTFRLLTAPAVIGPWTTNSAAVFQTISANSQFRFTAATSGASQRYYRIQMSP